MKYKELWEQMCQRCDELDKKLAEQNQPPIGFLNNHRQRINFEPNATGVANMPMTINWKIPLYLAPQPQRTWVGLTPDEIRGISLASGENLFSAIMFTHDKLKDKNT